jgi:hypothetical protein
MWVGIACSQTLCKKMRLLGHLADKAVLFLLRTQRVGSAHGLQLANLRDSDGRFYRSAFGAIGMIHEYGPHHLKRLRKRFDWIIDKRLCSGEGSTWPDYRLRLCYIDFLDTKDDVATHAFMATTLVEESVRSRLSIPKAAMTHAI